jgi:hypothetical protein
MEKTTKTFDASRHKEQANLLTAHVSAVNQTCIDTHYFCQDCGMDTQPGHPAGAEIEAAVAAGVGFDFVITSNHELYMLRQSVWDRTGLSGWGGVLCVGCCERRIGRSLKPKDFLAGHSFNFIPGTRRLLQRQGRARQYNPVASLTIPIDPELAPYDAVQRAWRTT